MRIDDQQAAQQLEQMFKSAEELYLQQCIPDVNPSLIPIADDLFKSPTKSYREALLGCGLAKLLNPAINIRHPYINHGDDAFNGRTMDEKVINPFLRARHIPASKGPYLATFRRSVKFVTETAQGLRDKKGYQAFLSYLEAFENATSKEEVKNLLLYLLYRFVQLREEHNIQLMRVNRLSLDQIDSVIGFLLQTRSGGYIPVLLTVAMLETLNQRFNLAWNIDWQDINVSDRAANVAGDITIRQNEQTIFVLEVTERSLESQRVRDVFETKMSIHQISDYLFIVTVSSIDESVQKEVVKYFRQNYDINILELRPWIRHLLSITGAAGRQMFVDKFIELIDRNNISSVIKTAWNEAIKQVLAQ